MELWPIKSQSPRCALRPLSPVALLPKILPQGPVWKVVMADNDHPPAARSASRFKLDKKRFPLPKGMSQTVLETNRWRMSKSEGPLSQFKQAVRCVGLAQLAPESVS